MFGLKVERVNERKTVDNAADQRNGRRHETGRGEDQSDKEDILGHTSIVADESVGVQAEVLMPYLRGL